MRPSSVASAALLSLVATAPPAIAQVHRVWDDLGGAFSAPGDVDGDGYDDFLNGYAGSAPGQIYSELLSGRTGAPLFTLVATGPFAGDYPSYSGTVGDVDGDGTRDLVVTGPGLAGSLTLPQILVFSGATGLEIRRHSGEAGPFGGLGLAPASVGDVDGDLRDDYVMGAWEILFQDQCLTLLFSGATGQVLATFPDGGRFLTPAGDLDGDGITDLAQVSKGLGTLIARSLPGGQVLYAVPVGAQGVHVNGIMSLADLDGDGVRDLGLVTDAGTWHLHSGADGRELRRGVMPGPVKFTRVAAIGDQDGDGFEDFWATPEPERGWIFSGATGERIQKENTIWSGAYGDANLDGRPDFFGAVRNAQTYDYEVTVRSVGRVPYCAPAVLNSTGQAAELKVLGSLRVADEDLELQAIRLPVGVPVAFLLSPAPRSLPGFGGGAATLCVGSPFAKLPASPPYSNGAGRAAAKVRLDFLPPLAPVQPGDALYVQAWYRDHGSPSKTSNAFRVWFN